MLKGSKVSRQPGRGASQDGVPARTGCQSRPDARSSNLLGNVVHPRLLLFKAVAEKNEATLPRMPHKEAVPDVLEAKRVCC